ncbi:hypothetical protein N7466_009420 [Penicillium verhagenii]|uniref:uncharacterized protein n=1 Tax=Penicillium verhagenii TaxID=1562060 RepID=UPI002545A483|nr:uncharacterized protein N7466_009420 [Penicillium verhagenii]KAJ5921094.1 hypothetical protein N7466_009420 [Penicillium verhagenii]
MSSPWASPGPRYRDHLDIVQYLLDNYRALAISAGQDPQTDVMCISYARDLRRGARTLLSRLFTADNIFFANMPQSMLWVGGPPSSLLRTISSYINQSTAQSFCAPPCVPCLMALLSAPEIQADALDECLHSDPSNRCRGCWNQSRVCYRLNSSISNSVMVTLTTAFRSELRNSLPALSSHDARRALILAMYSEHRRASWAEYLRYSPGTGAEPVPQPGSDVEKLVSEQECREPRLVEEVSDH